MQFANECIGTATKRLKMIVEILKMRMLNIVHRSDIQTMQMMTASTVEGVTMNDVLVTVL